MQDTNYQRIGSTSNVQVGKEFEAKAQSIFADQGIFLEPDFSVLVGAGTTKKPRKFDLGSELPPLLVECKSHTWTSGGNIPSAKITVWNEAMYYFHLAAPEYRKILFVLKDFSPKRGLTLATYYVRNYAHLVPDAVEIWEYDSESENAVRIH